MKAARTCPLMQAERSELAERIPAKTNQKQGLLLPKLMRNFLVCLWENLMPQLKRAACSSSKEMAMLAMHCVHLSPGQHFKARLRDRSSKMHQMLDHSPTRGKRNSNVVWKPFGTATRLA